MIEIHLDSPIPLGEQLVASLRQLLASGALKPGDELPPVRQLAADLGVNQNTVARAYKELEAMGLVVAARGRGTRVTSSHERTGDAKFAPAVVSHAAASTLEAAVARLLADAKLAGFGHEAVHALVERLAPIYWRSSVDRAEALQSPLRTSLKGDH